MIDWHGIDSRFRILLYLFGVAVVLLLVGTATYWSFDGAGVTVLNLMVSAMLTAALVLLYFKQTRLLESQRDLLTQELHREARQQHTETLRERVQIWHGNPEKAEPEDILDQSGLNLPAVQRASFSSAPTGSYVATSWRDESFQVVPYRLQDDRYLQDLLENHAPDLQETKQEIERLHERFGTLREDFMQTYDEGVVCDQVDYRLEPADYFDRWVFEFLVQYERGSLEDFDEIRERAEIELTQGSTGMHPDEPRLWIQAGTGGSSIAVYSALWTADDQEALYDWNSEIEAETLGVVEQILERTEASYPYEQTGEAAAILDDAAEAITELEQLLVEYDGRPIYTGDCTYLEEARIADT
jgi:hypothetical protein